MILAYSDAHIRDTGSFFPYNVTDNNGLTKELNNILRGFAFVADQIRLHKPKMVMNLGDLFQVTEFITNMSLFGAYLAMKMIKDACDEVGARHIAMNGNHDTFSEAHTPMQYTITSMHCLSGFYEYYTDLSFIDYDANFRISLIPHCGNDGKLVQWFHEAQQGSDLMAAHFNAQGAMYESGTPSDSLISPYFTKPCIAGDIHLPQDIGTTSYVGSLIQNKFYQNGLDRIGGVLLFDPNNGKIKRIPNTYSKHYVKVKDREGLVLPPADRVLLQFETDKSKEEVEVLLKGYDYMYIKAIKNVRELKTEYSSFSLAEPKDILRTFIADNNPTALGEFDNVIKENTSA